MTPTCLIPSVGCRACRVFRPGRRLIGAVMMLAVMAATAHAQKIANKTAVFSALDKVTARISKLEIAINETVQFGALTVTPRVCYSRPPEVRPKTTAFVQIDEKRLDGTQKRVFSGWMFAESPGLNAVEHPVFDIWLTSCGTPEQTAQATTKTPNAERATNPVPRRSRRRRIRR